MLIETIASNSSGEAVMVCPGSGLWMMAPSEIFTLCNRHAGCVKADLWRKRFYFLSLPHSPPFFFLKKIPVEFYGIPLLLVDCSLFLSGSTKGQPLVFGEWEDKLVYILP